MVRLAVEVQDIMQGSFDRSEINRYGSDREIVEGLLFELV